jgi:hypothetical protein
LLGVLNTVAVSLPHIVDRGSVIITGYRRQAEESVS